MYDVELVREILRQILEAGKRIERRFSPVRGAVEVYAPEGQGISAVGGRSAATHGIHERQ